MFAFILDLRRLLLELQAEHAHQLFGRSLEFLYPRAQRGYQLSQFREFIRFARARRGGGFAVALRAHGGGDCHRARFFKPYRPLRADAMVARVGASTRPVRTQRRAAHSFVVTDEGSCTSGAQLCHLGEKLLDVHLPLVAELVLVRKLLRVLAVERVQATPDFDG